MHLHGGNVICFIIFDEVFTQNKTLIMKLPTSCGVGLEMM
jgi:hypothetical protein